MVAFHTVPQPAGRLTTASSDSCQWSRGPMLPGPGWPQDNGAHTEPPQVMLEEPPALDPDEHIKACYSSFITRRYRYHITTYCSL